MDGKSRPFHRSAAAVSTMASASTTVDMRCRTRRAASVHYGLVARLHGFSAVGLVSANAAEAGFLCGCFSAGGCMCECASAFEFSEDGFFVGEEIADEAVRMAFVHS